MSEPGDVPPEILDRLRPICLALPETYEEPAWVGVRWRIRKRTFAHVLTVDPERQRAYALAFRSEEPLCVLTFRAPGEEIAGLVGAGYPFYKPGWGADTLGMVLGRVSEGEPACGGPQTTTGGVAVSPGYNTGIRTKRRLAGSPPGPRLGSAPPPKHGPGDEVDWVEVAELLTDSYRVLAPKRLAALVGQPPGAPADGDAHGRVSGGAPPPRGG